MKHITLIILVSFLWNITNAQSSFYISAELGVLYNNSKFTNHTGNALRKSDFTMNLALLRNINISANYKKNLFDVNFGQLQDKYVVDVDVTDAEVYLRSTRTSSADYIYLSLLYGRNVVQTKRTRLNIVAGPIFCFAPTYFDNVPSGFLYREDLSSGRRDSVFINHIQVKGRSDQQFGAELKLKYDIRLRQRWRMRVTVRSFIWTKRKFMVRNIEVRKNNEALQTGTVVGNLPFVSLGIGLTYEL